MIKGKDLILYVDVSGVLSPVKYAKDCQINISVDSLETTTKGSGNWHGYVTSARGATIQHSGLHSFEQYTASMFFIDAIMNRAKVAFTFSDYENQGIEMSGECIINTANITSPFDNISEITVGLTLDGPLLVQRNPIVSNLFLADQYGNKPQYCINGMGSLFPVGVYNINNSYLGSAANKAQVVSLWNADAANQSKGMLVSTTTDCQYTLNSPFAEDSLPRYIIVDTTNFIPTYGTVIITNQTLTLPVNSGTLSYTIAPGGIALVSHAWSYISGPNVPILNTSTGAYSGLVLGVYQFGLAMTYSDSHIDNYIETVTVNPQSAFTSHIQWGYSNTDQYAAVVGGATPTFQFGNISPTNLTPQTLGFTNSAQNMYIYMAKPTSDNVWTSWQNTGNNLGIFINDSVMYNVFTSNGLQYNMSRIPFQFDSFSSDLLLK
jgi:hypothetical protein